MRRFTWLISLAAVCVLVTACGGSSSKTSSGGTSTAANTGKVGGKLVIDNVYGGTWTCQFNPFNPSVLGPGITFAPVYEPLEFVNILQSKSPPVPMLATGSQWSNGFKTLTFTIRSGVTWSDGKPFSAADVAYTFNAMKADKTIDLNALWAADGGPLTSVAVNGDESGRLHVQRAIPADLLFRRGPDADRASAHMVDSRPEQASLVCRL